MYRKVDTEAPVKDRSEGHKCKWVHVHNHQDLRELVNSTINNGGAILVDQGYLRQRAGDTRFQLRIGSMRRPIVNELKLSELDKNSNLLMHIATTTIVTIDRTAENPRPTAGTGDPMITGVAATSAMLAIPWTRLFRNNLDNEQYQRSCANVIQWWGVARPGVFKPWIQCMGTRVGGTAVWITMYLRGTARCVQTTYQYIMQPALRKASVVKHGVHALPRPNWA